MAVQSTVGTLQYAFSTNKQAVGSLERQIASLLPEKESFIVISFQQHSWTSKTNHVGSEWAKPVRLPQDPRRSSSFLHVEATGLIGANIESDPEQKSSVCNIRLVTESELTSTRVLVRDTVEVRERPRDINGDGGLTMGSEAERGRAGLDLLDIASGPPAWSTSHVK